MQPILESSNDAVRLGSVVGMDPVLQASGFSLCSDVSIVSCSPAPSCTDFGRALEFPSFRSEAQTEQPKLDCTSDS